MRHAFGRRLAGKHQREFFAAIAIGLAAARHAPQLRGHHAQHLIAHVVAMGVVERLEMVHIGHRQRVHAAHALQALVQRAPPRQAGQLVAKGHVKTFVRQRNAQRGERRGRHQGQFNRVMLAARQHPCHAHETQPLPRLLRTPVTQQQQSQRQAGAQQRHQRFDRHAQARQLALHGQGAKHFHQAVLADQSNAGHADGNQANTQGQVQQHAGTFRPQRVDGVSHRPPGQRGPQRPGRFTRQRWPHHGGGQYAQHQRHRLRTLVHQADRRANQRHHPGHERHDQCERRRPFPPQQERNRGGHWQRGVKQQGQPGNMGVTHGGRGLAQLAEMTSPNRQTHIFFLRSRAWVL